MIYILLILALIIVLILWKNKKILLKIKMFFKNYKLLIIVELVILIALLILNMFNNTVMVMEKDAHSNKILKSVNLKEGETYTYKTGYYERNEGSEDIKDMFQNYKEKSNTIKIENIGITNVKVSINENEKEYKYGTGFSYYGIASCKCGTPIIFERILSNIIKIVAFIIIIIDLLLIILIKNKEENK